MWQFNCQFIIFAGIIKCVSDAPGYEAYDAAGAAVRGVEDPEFPHPVATGHWSELATVAGHWQRNHC